MHADVLCLCVSPRFPSFVALLRLVLSYDDIECLYLLPDLNVGCRVGGKHMSCAHLLLGPLPRSASPPGFIIFQSTHVYFPVAVHGSFRALRPCSEARAAACSIRVCRAVPLRWSLRLGAASFLLFLSLSST